MQSISLLPLLWPRVVAPYRVLSMSQIGLTYLETHQKITHEPITRIISKQLDIKLGPFTQEELDSVLRKIKNRKAAGLDEIPPEVWKTRQFNRHTAPPLQRSIQSKSNR